MALSAARFLQRCGRLSHLKSSVKHARFLSSGSPDGSNRRLELWEAPNMTDIGIRSIYNEDHDMFRQTARKFYQEEVVPYHAQWEKDGQVSRELWQKAGDAGLLGIDTPEECGGLGSDFLTASVNMEEQAYSHCSGPGWMLHSHIVMPYITHYGTKEQIEKFIPRMTAGTCIGAIAMTEPGAGSDLQGIRTNAKKDGDDYILNGSKVFITNGYMSDLVIVVAVTNPAAKSAAHGISLFLVEEGMEGFKKGKKLNKMGMKAQDTAELFFEDVRLPKSALLGKENHGFYYLMKELPQERLLIGIYSQAACEAIFEETRKYVKERKAFGKTLSNLQVIQHRLAEMKSEISVTRAFMDSCILNHSQRGLDSSTASIAKYWYSDLVNRIAYECVQLHGGWGYMMEYPVCKAYIDARVQPIYGGSNEIMKELIARQIIHD